MNNRWLTPFCLLLLLFLSVAFLMSPVTAEAVTIEMDLSPPSIEYTGTVTINGEPAPAGTQVTAYVDGQKKGSTTLSKDGGFDLSDALSVQGTRNDINQKISFSVTDTEGTEKMTSETKKYYPSDDTILSLSIGEKSTSGDGGDSADTHVDSTEETAPGDESVPDEITEPAEPSQAPDILSPLGSSQVIVTDVISQALSPISRVQEISLPITMAIERVEAITGLAIFDNFLAFLLIGFIMILFLILAMYRRDRESEEEREARLQTQSSLLAEKNRKKK